MSTTAQGIRAQGYVTAKEPDNHRIVRYSYVVGNRSYEGIGHGGAGNPSFDNLNIGTPVLVFYNARNPEVSTMGYPEHHLRVNLTGVLFLTLIGPLIVIGPMCLLYKLVGFPAMRRS